MDNRPMDRDSNSTGDIFGAARAPSMVVCHRDVDFSISIGPGRSSEATRRDARPILGGPSDRPSWLGAETRGGRWRGNPGLKSEWSFRPRTPSPRPAVADKLTTRPPRFTLAGVSMRTLTLCAALMLCAALPLQADDWSAFRGSKGDAVAEPPNAPLEWGPETHIRWKAPLGAPGNGSPIVSGNRVFIAGQSADTKQRGLYCFDKGNGRLLWSKLVPFEAEDPTHRTNPFCSSTPAADGLRVVVWHGSAGLYCYDFDGRELWKRDLGTFKHIWGYGSSPVIHAGKVFLNCGPGERTFVTAIDVAIGRTLWQVEEPGGDSGEAGADNWIGSWSTPVVTRVEGRDQVLVSLPYHVNAYDPETGKVVWSCDGLGKLVYTTPVVSEGIAIAMGGYHGPAIGFRLG
ncbi:MAG: hypothetical protein EHM42_14155, partial [Planctomycetaceae bacterium]